MRALPFPGIEAQEVCSPCTSAVVSFHIKFCLGVVAFPLIENACPRSILQVNFGASHTAGSTCRPQITARDTPAITVAQYAQAPLESGTITASLFSANVRLGSKLGL